MHVGDHFGRHIQAAAAAHRLTQMAVNFPCAPKPVFGGLPNFALAMAIADTNKHA